MIKLALGTHLKRKKFPLNATTFMLKLFLFYWIFISNIVINNSKSEFQIFLSICGYYLENKIKSITENYCSITQ